MKNLSLNMKMSALFIAFAIGSATIAYEGLSNINSINSAVNEVVTVNVPRIDYAYKVQSNFRLAAYLHLRYLNVSATAEMTKFEKDVDTLLRQMKSDLEEGLKLTSEKARPWWTESAARLNDWEAVLLRSRENKAAGDTSSVQSAISEMVSYRQQIEGQLQNIISLNSERMQGVRTETAALYSRAINFMVGLSAVMILSISALAAIVLRSTSRSIQEVIRNLTEGSIQVSAAAQQIASSSEELSQASTEQAASLEETAASVEEMNSMVSKNSENASAAANTSGKSQSAVKEGQQVIEKMLQAMEAINVSSEGMVETVAVIEQIDKETKVIHDIVNKTELLSFNASVEAARAGEHGKGFAVVAEEVGNLARMSGIAAEKIAALLEDSKRKVNIMVEETKKNVVTGAGVAKECGSVFDQIVQNVNAVSGMADEISSASQEQARGCAEITKAMNQLDQMTQQNAATSEECASAAEELSAQATSLNSAVNHLVATINGGVREHHESRSPAPARSADVIHLKNAVKKGTPRAVNLKKAVGAPSYDSDGFNDI